MTQKKYLLNNCLECPAAEENPSGPISNCVCGIDDQSRIIPDPNKFPVWCPLEDA